MIKEKIKNLVKAVKPHDDIEQDHIDDAVDWISSGVEIFRIEKDATPPKHLVSYSVVIDSEKEKILLFDHRKALLKLPSGGHVDVDEMPDVAAKRELEEELALSLDIHSPSWESETPFFITVTDTAGITERHTDVSLWYLFDWDSKGVLDQDQAEHFEKEFAGFSWMTYDEVLSSPLEDFDPNMHRFIGKLRGLK